MLWEPLFRSPEPQQSERLALSVTSSYLHRLDWRPFVSDPAAIEQAGPYTFVDGWLAQVHRTLAQFHMPDADTLLDWLKERRHSVPCAVPAPVHLDFHPAQLLLREDGSAIVIDWTQIQVSDPRFDLAWTLMLVGAAEGWAWRDRILAEYERLAGAPIEELDWFEVAACGKRLFSVIVSLAAGPEALGMRPEAVELMRQQFGALRNVYQLFVARTGLAAARCRTVAGGMSGALRRKEGRWIMAGYGNPLDGGIPSAATYPTGSRSHPAEAG